jgi:hypothetical protein
MTKPSWTATNTCAYRICTKAMRSMYKRRHAPPPIPIPVKPICNDRETTPQKLDALPRVAVELSNYPPSLSRHDIYALFTGFVIAPDFVPLASKRFLYPLRMFVWVLGGKEAERAVKELNGKILCGRQICVAQVNPIAYEQREPNTEELVDQLKVAIVSMFNHFPTAMYKSLTSRYCTCLSSSSRTEDSRSP